jgi:hypothetical protein
MPADGTLQFVQSLGKGAASRAQVSTFDGDVAVQVERRSAPGSQDIQLYDVTQLAHQFGESRISALYTLKTIRLIDEPELQRLKAERDGGAGQTIAEFLLVPEDKPLESARDDFRPQFCRARLRSTSA